MRNNQTSEIFLSAAQVRARYGHVSHMWLIRRANDGSGFPSCVKLGRLRFWKLADLEAWERARAGEPAKAKAQDAA